MAIGHHFTNKRRGNLLVWYSLLSGQPLLEILYLRGWYATHPHTSFFCAQ